MKTETQLVLVGGAAVIVWWWFYGRNAQPTPQEQLDRNLTKNTQDIITEKMQQYNLNPQQAVNDTDRAINSGYIAPFDSLLNQQLINGTITGVLSLPEQQKIEQQIIYDTNWAAQILNNIPLINIFAKPLSDAGFCFSQWLRGTPC